MLRRMAREVRLQLGLARQGLLDGVRTRVLLQGAAATGQLRYVLLAVDVHLGAHVGGPARRVAQVLIRAPALLKEGNVKGALVGVPPLRHSLILSARVPSESLFVVEARSRLGGLRLYAAVPARALLALQRAVTALIGRVAGTLRLFFGVDGVASARVRVTVPFLGLADTRAITLSSRELLNVAVHAQVGVKAVREAPSRGLLRGVSARNALIGPRFEVVFLGASAVYPHFARLVLEVGAGDFGLGGVLGIRRAPPRIPGHLPPHLGAALVAFDDGLGLADLRHRHGLV